MRRAPSDVLRSVGRRVKGLRSEKDAIVNFNWDEEVEFALYERSQKHEAANTLGSWRPGNFLVLRPHGSIGWYDLAQGIGNGDVYFISEGDERISRAERRLVAFEGNELPREIDGKREHGPLDCPPVMSAPTFAKKFGFVEQRHIWQDVLDISRRAREFIFLGYSLPKDDLLTRAALRAALKESRKERGWHESLRCLIVDKSFDSAKEENFRSVFGNSLSKGRNALEWTFGSDDRKLANRIEGMLRNATL
jgi:hypothetical protein